MITCYLDNQLGPVVGTSGYILDLAKCKHAIDYLTEHDMLPVEEVALGCSYEELTAICVRTGVSLGELEGARRQRRCHTIDRRPGPVCFSWKFSSY